MQTVPWQEPLQLWPQVTLQEPQRVKTVDALPPAASCRSLPSRWRRVSRLSLSLRFMVGLPILDARGIRKARAGSSRSAQWLGREKEAVVLEAEACRQSGSWFERVRLLDDTSSRCALPPRMSAS